jgi:membrane-anchored protein YejM (alkaline phosphatase superfamily)
MRDVRADLLRWCGWFFCSAAALFLLLALRYLPVVTLPPGAGARAFTVMMYLSQGALAAFLGVLLTMPLVLIAPRRRWVVPVSVAIALVVLTLAVIDGYVWQQYRLHLDASIWNLVTGGAFGETFVFATRTWLKLGLVVLLLGAALAGCAWFAAWMVRRPGRRAGVVLAATLAGLFVVQNGIYAWANAAGYTPVTSQTRILPGYRPLTAKRWLRKHGLMPGTHAPIKLAAGVGLDYPRAALDCAPPAPVRNVLFIVVDSWRADALTPEVTPNLMRLAAESQRFTNHVSGGNATRIGMFSLFYGVPGTYWHDMLGERRGAVFVQELMRQRYDVKVFRSAPLFSPEFDRTIFVGVPDLRLRSDGERAWQRDRDLTSDFIDWLDGRDKSRPFFALLFYDSPHKYDFPPDRPLHFQPSLAEVDYMAFTNKTDPAPFRNRYLNSVRYVDGLAGEAVAAVRARGLLEDTVLVVTSDHGQEFNDQRLNYWGHNSNFSRFQTQVPLFLRWPGEPPSVQTHATSHFDVPPTMLTRVLGCRNPVADYSVGRDLYDASPRGVLTLASFNDYAAVEPGKRHIVVWASGDIETLGPDYRPRAMSPADRHALQASLKQRSMFRPGADRS